MTKFSKILVVVVNNLKNPKNNQNKKISKALAFSLIELSIVLIIIGLLVAGVTGGASLIRSAKNRAIINEIRNYNQAVNSFYAMENRLPGDLNNTGKIGWGSGQSYNENSFPSPYNKNGNGYSLPNVHSAPWIDMYLKGVIDFEPKGEYTGSNEDTMREKGILPSSNIIKDAAYKFQFLENSTSSNNFKYNIANGNFLNIHMIDPDIAKDIDIKMDDGVSNTGNVRGQCANGDDVVSYDNSIKKCITFFRLSLN